MKRTSLWYQIVSIIEEERGCRGEEEDGVGEEHSSDEWLIQFRSSVLCYIASSSLLHLSTSSTRHQSIACWASPGAWADGHPLQDQ
jgi:hypothetical protein